MNRVFLATLMLMFLVGGAYAGPGDLDTSFGGGDGWVSTPPDLRADADIANSLIQQADGKLVVAGWCYNGSDEDFALARYNPDGSLDTTFNGTGQLTTAIGAVGDGAQSVIQQTDGKLVAAGWSYMGDLSDPDPESDIALVRYNSDGSLDTTFNGTGKLTTAVGTRHDWATSLIQQADGRLVVAGGASSDYSGNEYDFAVVRYNSDGSLDTTFNGTGMLMTDLGSNNDRAYSVIQQMDGKLVVAGHSHNGSNDDFALVRYNTDGSLDTSFSDDGIQITALGGSEDRAYSVIQQADGKLVAAGWSYNGSYGYFGLVRYNSDGSLDTAFSGDGKLTTAIGVHTYGAKTVIQQADGKLVAAGASESGGKQDFALVRYSSDGSLDTTFSDDGKLTTDLGYGEYANSVIQQADGKLVAAGYSAITSPVDIVLARYNSNGSLDAAFDADGMLTTNIAETAQAEALSVVRQADGKLVVAGHSCSRYNGSDNDFAVARYNNDGSLDTTFSGDGKLATAIGVERDYASAVIQQEDGRLVVAGTSFNGSNEDFTLVRYNSDGSLDATFNGSGMMITTFGTAHDGAYSVIQQIDGKLVAAGYSSSGVVGDYIALVRYNSDGSLDTTFNGTGKLTTDLGYGEYASSVIQQQDGKLVVAGYSYYDFALVRYNSDGSLDTTFNGTGKLTTDIGFGDDVAYSMIQQADGKLLVAGYSDNGSDNDFALARYNSDGSLDTTFDADGKLTTAVSSGDDRAHSVIQQADGKLVIAGYSAGYSDHDAVLVRYNSDGSLDTTFNSTGILTMAFGAANDVANAVIQQPDGKLVVAGYSSGMPTGQEFIVARFESGQLDTDNDGYIDGLDNCTNVLNPGQLNTDSDAFGNACDVFPLNSAEWLDTDSDGIGNNADMDDDGDGVPDYIDADPLDAAIHIEKILPLNSNYQGSSIKDSVLVQ